MFFFQAYINVDGIKTFFKLISQDIKPEYCIVAQQTYEKEKEMLANICGGLSDDVLAAQLSEFLNKDEALNRLASHRQSHIEVAEQAVGLLGDIFKGDIDAAQTCGPGGGAMSPYHDSQGHAASYAGDAIYKTIETYFEYDMKTIKTIYSDADTQMANLRKLAGGPGGGAQSQQQKLLQTPAKDADGADNWAAQADTFAANFGDLEGIGVDYDPLRVADRLRKNVKATIQANHFLVKFEAPTPDEEVAAATPPHRRY